MKQTESFTHWPKNKKDLSIFFKKSFSFTLWKIFNKRFFIDQKSILRRKKQNTKKKSLKESRWFGFNSVRCHDNSCWSGASAPPDSRANHPTLSKIFNSAQLLRSSVFTDKKAETRVGHQWLTPKLMVSDSWPADATWKIGLGNFAQK